MLIVWLFVLAGVGIAAYVLVGLGKQLFKRGQGRLTG
jgi:hypothetical protein